MAQPQSNAPKKPSGKKWQIIRAVAISTWLVWGLLLLALVSGIWAGAYSTVLVTFLTFVLTLLPFFFARRFHIFVPRRFMASIILFIFATLFLGEVADFYNRYPWWDVVLHGGSAVGFGLIGFVTIFMLFQGDRYAAPPSAMGIFAFSFAMSIGATWEIFEYGMDQIFGLNMQKSGLSDTMQDLIVDAVGAFVGAFSGVVYLLGAKGTPFSGMLRDFITKNSQLFKKYRDR